MIHVLLLVAVLGGPLAAVEGLAPLIPELICCSRECPRTVEVRDAANDLTGASLRVAPATLLKPSVRVVNAHHLILSLEMLANGSGTVELLDARSTVIARSRIQVVDLATNVAKGIGNEATLADGSEVFVGDIIMRPYVPGLDIRFVSIGKQVTVPDGLHEWWIASEAFTPTPSTGNAHVGFRMVRAPGQKWVPFTYLIYQDGVQVNTP